jgi:hypothetical protein
MKTTQLALAGLLISLCPSSALAGQTWWIDDGGGAGIDFTDIQPAIDAASGGDILIIHPGSYSGFNLGKNLTLLGSEASDTSVVTGHVTISGLPGPTRAVLTGLRLQTLDVISNNGPVILDSLKLTPSTAGTGVVKVSNCSDVRMYQCTVTGPYSQMQQGSNAVEVVASRFEVVDSILRGANGTQVGCDGTGGNGGTALWCATGSIISAFQSNCYGGAGGDTEQFCEWTDPLGGDGGDGMFLRGGSTGVIAGSNMTRIEHGREGYGDTFPTFNDGYPGHGLSLAGGSTVRYSGVNVTTTQAQPGSTITLGVPADPFLERTGTLQAGRKQTFWINGTPGDQVTFFLGRSPIVAVDGAQEMDNLVTHERAYNLGAIPATGRLKFEFTIPTFFPTAFSFFSQAEVTTASGSRLTNSLPIVLRYLP